MDYLATTGKGGTAPGGSPPRGHVPFKEDPTPQRSEHLLLLFSRGRAGEGTGAGGQGGQGSLHL